MCVLSLCRKATHGGQEETKKGIWQWACSSGDGCQAVHVLPELRAHPRLPASHTNAVLTQQGQSGACSASEHPEKQGWGPLSLSLC